MGTAELKRNCSGQIPWLSEIALAAQRLQTMIRGAALTKEDVMALDIRNEKGISLEQQIFTWRDLVRTPISKLNDDAFTRVRIILMNGIEMEALNFQHTCARMNHLLRLPLAQVRMVEKHQQTL